MASMTTMEKLLLFHKLESDLFHRLVHDLAQDPAAMRWVIALWLWLESVGHHNFIRRVAALPGPVVLRFVEEAVACLRCLAGQCQAATADVEDGRGKRLPCTNALLTEPIDDAGYFQSHREILDGVTHYYRSVCLAVCNVNNSTTCMPNNTAGVPVAPPMVSSPIHTTPRVAPLPLNPMAASFPLNPMATPWIPMQSPLMEAPWIPMQSPLPDDYRSLFITFSKGYPISREDIMEFFDSVFGPCVETVMVEKVAPGQQPVYGRVILRSAAMIPVVLDGRQTAKFMIKGKHLWARIYIPSSRLSYP
ncbi:hypothetical protein SETIT_9G323100v2 [Setaria italica]|uniref:RRM domain-containing protein n=2 Tax=Setaria TaxID=4554 RepID=K4AD26_SETIT|nr:uncharacterized protein LOC101774482 [Setaria italica]XP_034577358.1 uncharacterized protein LOC117840919 [Setaria viridis]RCV43803.1 hypothetical protein SETIT_9G323100v2 [Setaria italica]TKV94940.1 hypothetical protein SEVIR_9G328800v2 [Setaria viridis]